jgi:hypothetical protein
MEENLIIATNMQRVVDSMLFGTLVRVRVLSGAVIQDSVILIEKEDGSGKNFNIVFTHSLGQRTFVKFDNLNAIVPCSGARITWNPIK